jgi:tRNA pseudouridine38-40 synthase
MEPVHYQLKLAYDGTHFYGFQRQAKKRTVQAEVESALRKLGWTDESILFAGRTDTGVHASGQVVAVNLIWQHSEEELLHALNAGLPEDIAATACTPAAATFHPRFDACARQYCYTILCEPFRQPLAERYAWRVWPQVDYSALQEAAAILPGVYDCAAFGRAPIEGGSTIRAIYNACWQQQADHLFLFTITANAFLYHMVRRIVYCLVRIGLKRMTLPEFEMGIQSGSLIARGLAPAHGLNLMEVRYKLSEQEFQLIKSSGFYHLELSEIGDIDRGKNLRD